MSVAIKHAPELHPKSLGEKTWYAARYSPVPLSKWISVVP